MVAWGPACCLLLGAWVTSAHPSHATSDALDLFMPQSPAAATRMHLADLLLQEAEMTGVPATYFILV